MSWFSEKSANPPMNPIPTKTALDWLSFVWGLVVVQVLGFALEFLIIKPLLLVVPTPNFLATLLLPLFFQFLICVCFAVLFLADDMKSRAYMKADDPRRPFRAADVFEMLCFSLLFVVPAYNFHLWTSRDVVELLGGHVSHFVILPSLSFICVLIVRVVDKRFNFKRNFRRYGNSWLEMVAYVALSMFLMIPLVLLWTMFLKDALEGVAEVNLD